MLYNPFSVLVQAIDSLDSQPGLNYEIYDKVVAEPTEESWRDAIAWARSHDISHFLALVILEFDFELQLINLNFLVWEGGV